MASHLYDSPYLTITQDEDGSRIDRAISRAFPNCSRTLIMRLIRRGNVRVNAKRVKPMQRLHINDKIFIPASLRKETNTDTIKPIPQKPKSIPNILYEDADLLILNKIGGEVVHAGSGYQHGLIEQLRVHMQLPQLDLAHRLDKDTSGCLVFAKHLASLRKLTQGFRLKETKKTYLAWVKGHPFPTASSIDKKLSKGKLQGGERMVIDDESGTDARTDYQLIFRAAYHNTPYALVALQPHTGRTHQLRVHMQTLGHPILGDRKYATQTDNRFLKEMGGKGMALHAWRLQFQHPITKKAMEVAAPWPAWWNTSFQQSSLSSGENI